MFHTIDQPSLLKFYLWLLNNFDVFIEFCSVQKLWASKGDIFTPFCYKFIQVTACTAMTYYTPAWLSYCKTKKGAILYAS